MSTTRTIPRDLFPLVQAAEQATGKRFSLSTILRWCTKPRKGIVLESWVVGGHRYTSPSAVEQYIRDLTEASTPTLVKPSRTQRQRELAIARAEKTIAALSPKQSR